MPTKYMWETKYNKIRLLGEGGNGNVFEVSAKCETGNADEHFALKYLHTDASSEKKKRFLKEIQAVSDGLKDIDGIIPIFDYSIDEYWYVMPLATGLTEHIYSNGLKFDDIITIGIKLAKIMDAFHSKGFSHRDIKPDNILWYNNEPCFCDFGLVKEDGNTANLTKNEKNLGAKFTMAPEMKRNPSTADGKKADVYSFAKTIWMLLTGNELGFEGTYNFEDSEHSLRRLIKKELLSPEEVFDDNRKRNKEKEEKIARKQLHLVELENLLKEATANDPESRPDSAAFIKSLEEYIMIKNDSERSQKSDWEFLSKYLFNGITPKSTVWVERTQIERILNILGSVPSFNHTFLPSRGGVDFEDACIPTEQDCLELHFDYETSIVKPKALYFESFGADYSWNYFLLETGELEPIFPDVIEQHTELVDEYLCEDIPGNYVSDSSFSYGVYDYDTGEKLPPTARRVVRYLRGNFLFALKLGDYNKIASAYDARHSNIEPFQFRMYCDCLLLFIHEIGDRKRDNFLYSDIPDKIFDECFPEANKSKVVNNRKQGEKPSPYIFIKENITRWNYKDVVNKYDAAPHGNIGFCFEISETSGISFSELDKDCHFIAKDGSVFDISFWDVHKNNIDSDKTFWLYRRENAFAFKHSIMEMIRSECNKNGYDDKILDSLVTIHIMRQGKPSHIFTIDEIEKEIRNADDRSDTCLVIDEDGYAHVYTVDCRPLTYPVSYSIWCAGNGYVGKYANLDEPYLRSIYRDCLVAWLLYLECGRHSKADNETHSRQDAEEVLLKKIKEYY